MSKKLDTFDTIGCIMALIFFLVSISSLVIGKCLQSLAASAIAFVIIYVLDSDDEGAKP